MNRHNPSCYRTNSVPCRTDIVVESTRSRSVCAMHGFNLCLNETNENIVFKKMKKILICEINNIVFLCILILFKSRKNSNEGKNYYNYYNYYHILFALRIQYVFMLVRNHLTLKQSSLLIKKKKEKKNEVVHLLCF